MASFDPLLRTSLYVGDLHPEVTQNDIAETFQFFGPLVSVHLCLDKITRRSRCYAYVNFYYNSDAQMALNSLNHTALKGKAMRIMWCQKNPIARKNNIGNLFVKNLDSSITSAQLQEHFSKYGTILSCKVAEYEGISKGFGFVQFDAENSAMAALNALHGTMLGGKKLYVSKFIKTNVKKDVEAAFTNLYVKYIDKSITESFLKAKFSEYGNVCNAVIMKDEQGKSKGFGFVRFYSHEAAKKAIEALNGQLIGSKKLFVGRAQTKAERTELLRRIHGDKWNYHYASKLYVMNLDTSIDDATLENLFSCHGKVISAKVIRYYNGISKGFGFVQFSCPNEAMNAKKLLNGTYFHGRTLYVALAQNKQQTAHLQKPYAVLPPQQPYCNFAPWLPTLYQSFYPSPAHNFQNAYYVCPMQLATSNCGQDNYSVGIWKDQNPSGKLQNMISNGDANEFFKGSGAVKTVLPWYNTKTGNAIQLEMTKPDKQRLLTLPKPGAVNVKKSVQLLRGNIKDFR